MRQTKRVESNMSSTAVFRVRLLLTPASEGGFVVTSPDLPELLTEGDSAAEALANVPDALAAVRELYEDMKRPLPPVLRPAPTNTPVAFETLIEAA